MKYIQLYEQYLDKQAIANKKRLDVLDRELLYIDFCAFGKNYKNFTSFDIQQDPNAGLHPKKFVARTNMGFIAKRFNTPEEGEEWIKKVASNPLFKEYVALSGQPIAHVNDVNAYEELLADKNVKQLKKSVIKQIKASVDYESFIQQFTKNSLLKTPIYHGTPHDFVDFELGNYQNTERVDGTFQYYFTDSKSEAREYGENIIECFINIENPYREDGDRKGLGGHWLIMDEAGDAGNDCVVLDMSWANWYLFDEANIWRVINKRIYDKYKK